MWVGSGVWIIKLSELGVLFFNKWLVCVPGDNMTIFVDVLVAWVAPDPPVNGQALPNSFPVVFHLLAQSPGNCTHGRALQPHNSKVQGLH